jgi:ribonuclease BN (tRNA processing enzyme)
MRTITMTQQQQQRWTSRSIESSSSSLPSSYHRRPLHRNPSRIESAIGSIYRPPDFFLGINDPIEEDSDDADNDDGNSSSLFLPEDDTILSDSIGSCIKVEDDDEIGDETRCATTDGRNTEMSVCFLGTGAGSPACSRSTSGTLLKLFGTNYLFDAGEGIQRQLQFARGRSGLQKIDKIFITHMHGDHIFGLPGLLLSLQTSYMHHKSQTNTGGSKKKGRNDNHSNDDDSEEQANIKIYGPPGLFNYIASSITLSCTKLHSLNVEVYELVGGRVRKSTTPPSYGGGASSSSSNSRQHPLPRITQKNIRDPFHDDYLEYHHYGGRIKRIRVPCKNGVWNIQDVEPIKKEDIINQKSASRTSRRFRSLESKRHKRIHIKAAEVDHVPGVATFGYVVLEDGPPHNLDVEKARSLGVSHKNMKYDLLKYGFPVIADMNNNDNNNSNNNNDDGNVRSSLSSEEEEEEEGKNIVHPHEVVKSTTNKKARKIAFIGDNRGWTREMTNIARNADVLIHEATLLEEDYNVREF